MVNQRLIADYLEKSGLYDRTKNFFGNRIILVAGGAGAIGSNAVNLLSYIVGGKGKVIILDNLSSYKKASSPFNLIENSNVIFINGDIREDADLKRVFKYDISIVFHLAAFFANQNSVDYPETSANVDVLGTMKLLEYSVLKKVEKFVFASSSCIYEFCTDIPFNESYTNYNFSTPYQAHKALGEMYCNYYHHKYGLNVVNCRFFNSFGPGELPGKYRNVIPNFIYNALNNKPLIITGDGSETRDFTFVYDLIQGLLLITQSNSSSGAVFNLGNGKETSVKELSEKIISLTNSKSEIIYTKKRDWDKVNRRVASIEKVQKYGYNPVISLEEGFKQTIDWFKKSGSMISSLID